MSNKKFAGFRQWVPQPGERYYYISQNGTVSSQRCGTSPKFYWKMANGNVFKSYRQCKNVLLKRINELQLPYIDIGNIHIQYFRPISNGSIVVGGQLIDLVDEFEQLKKSLEL